jgi:signal transduction histidine kinase
MARVGGWELDLETSTLIWTEEVYRIHEVPFQFVPTLASGMAFYAPEDRPMLDQVIQRARETGEPWDLELRLVTATGKRLWVRAIGRAELRHGQVVKLAGTLQDITARKQAEQALRDAIEVAEQARRQERERRREAERRHLIAHSLADIVASLNSDQTLEQILDYIALQARQLLENDAVAIFQLQGETGGLALRAAQGLSTGCLANADTSLGLDALREAVELRRPVPVPDLAPLAVAGTLLPSAGEARLCQALLAVPIVVKEEVYGGMSLYYARSRSFSDEDVELAAVFGDQVALAIENARLREQVKQAAATAERSRLARDLHDSVTQALFSASLVAEVLPQVWRRDPEEAQEGLEELRHLTRGALAEMRTMLLELRPAVVVETRLEDLLRQLSEAVTGRVQIHTLLNLEPSPALPPEVHLTFYRVAQEALHNVVKHATASKVSVRLQVSPPIDPVCTVDWHGQVMLHVSDDGQGFNPDHTRPDQLGLAIMRERAVSVGAELAIESQPNHGTEVILIWQNSQAT